MAKVLIVNGSQREKSNSRLLASYVASGASEKGHVVYVLEIGKLTIRPCRGCEACLAPGSGGCVIEDDMTPLYPRIAAADIVILSSPIYWFNLCGQMKQFLDRCFAIAVNRDPGEQSIFAAKTFGAVFVYGDRDPFVSGCVNAIRSLQDMCAYTGAKWANAIYGSAYDAGEIDRDPVLLAEAKAYGAAL